MDRDVLTDLASGKEYPLKPLGEVRNAHVPDCGNNPLCGLCSAWYSWHEGPFVLIVLLSEVMARLGEVCNAHVPDCVNLSLRVVQRVILLA